MDMRDCPATVAMLLAGMSASPTLVPPATTHLPVMPGCSVLIVPNATIQVTGTSTTQMFAMGVASTTKVHLAAIVIRAITLRLLVQNAMTVEEMIRTVQF
jgi:hypothetical protein